MASEWLLAGQSHREHLGHMSQPDGRLSSLEDWSCWPSRSPTPGEQQRRRVLPGTVLRPTLPSTALGPCSRRRPVLAEDAILRRPSSAPGKSHAASELADTWLEAEAVTGFVPAVSSTKHDVLEPSSSPSPAELQMRRVGPGTTLVLQSAEECALWSTRSCFHGDAVWQNAKCQQQGERCSSERETGTILLGARSISAPPLMETKSFECSALRQHPGPIPLAVPDDWTQQVDDFLHATSAECQQRSEEMLGCCAVKTFEEVQDGYLGNVLRPCSDGEDDGVTTASTTAPLHNTSSSMGFSLPDSWDQRSSDIPINETWSVDGGVDSPMFGSTGFETYGPYRKIEVRVEDEDVVSVISFGTCADQEEIPAILSQYLL